jgi:hypothetical protein
MINELCDTVSLCEDRPLYEPQHQAFIEPERHDPDIGSIIRGLVMQMEVFLSAKSTQKVILLDGSFTSRLIQMNQAINANIKINEKSGRQTLTGKKVVENFEQFLKDYQTVLKSSERSQIWASIPKLTTRNEIGEKMGWEKIEWYNDYNDRTILTSILAPGEFTDPVKMKPRKNEDTHTHLLRLFTLVV